MRIIGITLLAWAVLAGATPSVAQVPAEQPRPHPYLYFNAGDLPAIRERLQREPFATRWNRFLTATDDHLRRDVLRSNPRMQLGIVGMTSFAYAITGERKYAERAHREMMAMLDEGPWHEDLGYNKGANLETAERSVAAALFYDWCHDYLDEEQWAAYRQRVLERSTRVYLRSVEQHRDWWVENPVSNWAGVCHGGCGLAALAMYAEEPEARKAVEIARSHVTRFLLGASLEDGAGHEGIMYWRYGTEFGHYLAYAGRRYFGDDGGLYAATVNKLNGYWDAYMFAPDALYANFNNMGEHTFQAQRAGTENGPSASLAALFEAEVPGGDPLLLWSADTGHSAYYWQGVSPLWFIWRRDDAPPATSKPPLHDAVLFRGAGHAIFQSPSLWMAFNGGWISNRSHHNFDLGTFVLVANGERFVNDPGYGRTSTAEHSTLTVRGRGQKPAAQARYLAFGSGEGFHYLASDLSSCYHEPLERFTRHLVMVGGRHIVLLDDVVLGEPAEAPKEGEARPTYNSALEWRLQTRRRVHVNERTATLQARGKLQVLAVLPEDAKLSVQPTIDSTRGRRDNARFEHVLLTPEEDRREETMLVVLYPVAPNAESSPRASATRDGDLLTLKVAEGERTDHIVFARGEDAAWKLRSVNGRPADHLGPPRERSLVPFRQQ